MKRAAAVIVATVAFTTLAVGARAGSSSATVTPGSALLDGQYVSVHWTGFPASTDDEQQGVSVAECKADAKDPASDCAASIAGVSTTSGDGTLHAIVHTGSIASKDKTTTFVCDQTHACEIAVYVDPSRGLSDASSPSATAPISFGFPASACPDDAASVSGSGAEGPNRALIAWSSAECQPPSSVDVQYARTESDDGRQAFLAEAADFGATSLPFTDADLAQLSATKRTFAYAPLTASALAIVFNGVDRVTGQPLSTLTLTPAILAHIFNGQRTSFPTRRGISAEDDEILDLNPGVSFFPNVQAFGRLDRAAGTWELTSWFLSAAASAWKDTPPWVAQRPSNAGGKDETADYAQPTESLPDGLQGPGAQNQLVDGSDNLATIITGHGSVGNNTGTTTFGYVDSSTAVFYGLSTVCLQLDPNWQTSHRPCVSATPDSIERALDLANRDADGTVTPNYAPADTGAYPIIDVSYAIVPQHVPESAKTTALAGVLAYAAADGQDKNLPLGYAPLPADLSKETTDAAAAIADAPTTTPSAGVVTPAPRRAPSSPIEMPFVRTSAPRPVTSAVAPEKQAASTSSPVHVLTSAVSQLHLPVPGGRLSAATSWALLLGLSVLSGVGLLLRPYAPWFFRRRSR